MHWSEIRNRQPALGAVADRLLIEPGVLLAGTTRRDGTARISGVEHVARWPSGEEYIRPQLTPTSLGPQQAVSRQSK